MHAAPQSEPASLDLKYIDGIGNRCVIKELISIGGSVHQSVGPSECLLHRLTYRCFKNYSIEAHLLLVIGINHEPLCRYPIANSLMRAFARSLVHASARSFISAFADYFFGC